MDVFLHINLILIEFSPHYCLLSRWRSKNPGILVEWTNKIILISQVVSKAFRKCPIEKVPSQHVKISSSLVSACIASVLVDETSFQLIYDPISRSRVDGEAIKGT